MSSRHTPVAIVGGGPCGLALALQLAQRRVACTVFEKKAGLSTHPKAMGISRRSSEILREIGVLNALYDPCRHLTEGADVLVRPDGYAAARWRSAPPAGAVDDALAMLLWPDRSGGR